MAACVHISKDRLVNNPIRSLGSGEIAREFPRKPEIGATSVDAFADAVNQLLLFLIDFPHHFLISNDTTPKEALQEPGNEELESEGEISGPKLPDNSKVVNEYEKTADQYLANRNEAIKQGNKDEVLRWTMELATLNYEFGELELAQQDFQRIITLLRCRQRILMEEEWDSYLREFRDRYEKAMNMAVVSDFKRDRNKLEALVVEETRRNHSQMCEWIKLDIGISRRTTHLKLCLKSYRIKQLANAIGADDVIVLKVYDGKLMTWVLTSKGDLSYSSIREVGKDIQKLVDDMTFADADTQKSVGARQNARIALNKLSRIILGPIAHLLKRDKQPEEKDSPSGRLLYFLPCLTLFPIPFAALKIANQYLIEEHRVAQGTSLISSVYAREVWRNTKDKKTVADISRINPFIGGDSMESGILRAKDLFEAFANPSESSDRRRPKLPILNATHPGSDRSRPQPRDIEDLVRASLGAGCPCVLASKWQVPEEGSKRILEAFCCKLKENLSVSDAWHKALKELVQGGELDYKRDFDVWSAFLPHGYTEMIMNKEELEVLEPNWKGQVQESVDELSEG